MTCPFAVSVTVVEAAGIKRSELFNADPFAWVRLGGTSQKTKVRKSTRWVCALVVTLGDHERAAESVGLRVYEA